MRNLDILIMSDTSLETIGGEQESTKIILEGMKDVFSIGIIHPGILLNEIPGVEFFKLTEKKRLKDLIKKPINFIKYINQARGIINTTKPRIIHTQAQVSFFMVTLLKKMGLISKSSFIIHTERGLYTKYNRFFKGLFYFFMKDLNVLLTTTDFNMYYWEKIQKKKGLNFKTKVIENTGGKTYEKINMDLLDKNNDTITVGFAGRYADWKNWPLAVEISKKLNDVFPNKVQIKMAVGCINKYSYNQTNQMFNEMNELLGNRFEGMININQTEMNQFYYDIDFFILTSNENTESFGRTLVEAMSRMTIVLTTSAGGAVEVVGNNQNVLTTAYEFVERIENIYRDKIEMKNQMNNNLKRVRSNYSLDNNIFKHKKMYKEVLHDSIK